MGKNYPEDSGGTSATSPQSVPWSPIAPPPEGRVPRVPNVASPIGPPGGIDLTNP